MMTEQEAIKLLEDLLLMADFKDSYGDAIDHSPYSEAVDMATEALEKIEMYEPKLKYGYYSLPMPSLCEVCGAKECMFKSEYVSSCPEAHFKKGNLND